MTVENIENHMAKTCVCGSANFALLKSGGIECNKCGTSLDAKWWSGGLGAQIARAIKAEGERDALQAKLDAQQAQEPVRFVSYENTHPEDRWAASQMPDAAEGQCPHCGNFDPPTQQVQEPVAWMYQMRDGMIDCISPEEHAREEGEYTIPLYTVPQAPAPKQAEPEGYKLVPVKFLQAFNNLAHNYSLTAIAPDYYQGTEGDAFKSACRRCGDDLAKVAAMLAAAPTPPEAK